MASKDHVIDALRRYDDSLPKHIEDALDEYAAHIEMSAYNVSGDIYQTIIERIQDKFMEGGTSLFEAFECMVTMNYGLAGQYLQKTFNEVRDEVVQEYVEAEYHRLLDIELDKGYDE